MEQQQIPSETMGTGRFSREEYRQNPQAFFDHAERTGWAEVVDENDRPVWTLNVLLEDLPPLFGDEEEGEGEETPR